VKTRAPAVVDRDLAVDPGRRAAELARLAATVNPTVRAMEGVLSGGLEPVPTQAPLRTCGQCPYRGTCAASWK
jgi:hypothetical protein